MEYKTTRHTRHLLNYHFVWVPRRRRAVLKGDIAKRLRELIWETSRAIDCEIVSLAIEPDHVHCFINCPPTLAPYQIAHRLKGASAHALRKEFPSLLRLPSLWTSSYFVSTAGNVSSETIRKYIEAQSKSE